MLIKIFKHGTSRGEKATDYLMDTKFHNRKECPPTLLRGDPQITRDLINSLDTKWKYTSGVLSWHPDDKVSPEKDIELMNDFEKLAFAGLEKDQYNILWVRHRHANHHELHFVIPRVELHRGKSFNPCPPNWQKDFTPLRDYYNIKENWARPDDPERALLITPASADITENRNKRLGIEKKTSSRDEIRKLFEEYIVENIRQGKIKCRDDIITYFKEYGFEINRQGKEYITILNKEDNTKIRFRGAIFHEDFRFETTNAEGLTKEYGNGRGNSEEELSRLRADIAAIIEKRAEYNGERYKGKNRRKSRRFREKDFSIFARRARAIQRINKQRNAENQGISANNYDRYTEHDTRHQFQDDFNAGLYRENIEESLSTKQSPLNNISFNYNTDGKLDIRRIVGKWTYSLLQHGNSGLKFSKSSIRDIPRRERENHQEPQLLRDNNEFQQGQRYSIGQSTYLSTSRDTNGSGQDLYKRLSTTSNQIIQIKEHENVRNQEFTQNINRGNGEQTRTSFTGIAERTAEILFKNIARNAQSIAESRKRYENILYGAIKEHTANNKQSSTTNRQSEILSHRTKIDPSRDTARDTDKILYGIGERLQTIAAYIAKIGKYTEKYMRPSQDIAEKFAQTAQDKIIENSILPSQDKSIEAVESIEQPISTTIPILQQESVQEVVATKEEVTAKEVTKSNTVPINSTKKEIERKPEPYRGR